MAGLTLIPLVGAFVAVATGALVLRPQHRTATSAPLAVVMAAAAVWALGGVVASVSAPPVARASLVVVSTSAAFLVLGGAWYSVLFSGRSGLWTPRLAGALLEPAVVLLLALTSPWHDLLVRLEPANPSGVAFGPLFWAHTAYCYAVLAVCTLLLVRAWRASVRGQRWHLAVAVLAIGVPMVGNVVSLCLVSRRFSDFTSVAFVITALTWLWAERWGSRMRRVPVSTAEVLRLIGDAVLVLDADGRLVEANPAAQDMLGPSGLGLVPAGRRSEPLDGRALAAVRQGGSVVVGGRMLDVRTAAIRTGGQDAGTVVVVRDVSDLEALRAELAEQAVRDSLTGLHNRRHLDRVLDDLVHASWAARTPLCAAMVDVDHFKAVNDAHGHGVGDRVLQAVAHRLHGATRDEDVLVRFGGEEFLLLLPATRLDDAHARLDAVRRACAEHAVPTPHGAVAVTVSAGVASLAGPEPDDLLRAADDALYAAKAGGRNRVVAGLPGVGGVG